MPFQYLSDVLGRWIYTHPPVPGDIPFGDEFDDVVFNAPVGSIIGPVQTQYGIHVIKILDKKKVDVKDLDELKNEITIQMKMKAREKIMKQWIKGLRARAFVENFGFD